MKNNLINFVFILIVLFFCSKKPRAGIIASFLLLLGLPLFFTSFGFSFGAGEKYLSNLLIVEVFYAAYFFILAREKRIIKGFDVAIIIYLVLVSVVSFIVSDFSINIAILVKQFIALPLFYFMGRVLIITDASPGKNYSKFRRSLLALAIYMLAFFYFEYFTKINVHAILLFDFTKLVGSNVVADPFIALEQQLISPFYRVTGPLQEPTETSLVLLILLIVYMSWAITYPPKNKIIFYSIIFLLIGAIVLSSTRIVMLAVLPTFFISELFGYKRIGRIYFISIITLFLVYFLFLDGGVIIGNLFGQISKYSYFSVRLLNTSTIQGRLLLWGDAWNLLKDHLFLGIGVGTPVYLPDDQGNIFLYTVHNFFLDTIIFQGIVGAIFLSILWCNAIWRSMKILGKFPLKPNREITLTHIMLFVAMLVFNLASPEKIQISSIFWFYTGMVVSLRIKRKFQEDHE